MEADMAWEKIIEAILGDMRKDFNRGLSRKKSGGPMFGRYGIFLPVYIRYPSRAQACPASRLPSQKIYGNYSTRHDLPIQKSDANKIGETTIKPERTHDQLDYFDDSLAAFTLCEANKLRCSADQLKATGGDNAEVVEFYLHSGLKFLKAAYLLECYIIPGIKSKPTPNAIFSYYIDAANLFKYCAKTSEENGKLEVAVLAYKCMEGAAMDASRRYRALELVIQYHSCTKEYEAKIWSSIKKTLDFSFYNVEEFIHLMMLSLSDIGS